MVNVLDFMKFLFNFLLLSTGIILLSGLIFNFIKELIHRDNMRKRDEILNEALQKALIESDCNIYVENSKGNRKDK